MRVAEDAGRRGLSEFQSGCSKVARVFLDTRLFCVELGSVASACGKLAPFRTHPERAIAIPFGMGMLLVRRYQSEDEARAGAIKFGGERAVERVLLRSRPRWRRGADGSVRFERRGSSIAAFGVFFAMIGVAVIVATALLREPMASSRVSMTSSAIVTGCGFTAGLIFVASGGFVLIAAPFWVQSATSLCVRPDGRIEAGAVSSLEPAELLLLERLRVDIRYRDSRREANREQVRALVKTPSGYLRILLWDAEQDTGLPEWSERLIGETEGLLAVKGRILRSPQVEWRFDQSDG